MAIKAPKLKNFKSFNAQEAIKNDYWKLEYLAPESMTDHQKKCLSEQKKYEEKQSEHTNNGGGGFLMLGILLYFFIISGVWRLP